MGTSFLPLGSCWRSERIGQRGEGLEPPTYDGWNEPSFGHVVLYHLSYPRICPGNTPGLARFFSLEVMRREKIGVGRTRTRLKASAKSFGSGTFTPTGEPRNRTCREGLPTGLPKLWRRGWPLVRWSSGPHGGRRGSRSSRPRSCRCRGWWQSGWSPRHRRNRRPGRRRSGCWRARLR